MAKLTLTDLTSEVGFTPDYNANSALIEAAFENTVSRDGTSPNAMNANLDMNSNRILNLPAPQGQNEPVRYADLLGSGLVTLTGAEVPNPITENGKFLKSNGTAFPVWATVPVSPLGIDNLVTPGVDRIMFFDQSQGFVTFLEASTGLNITGTVLSVSMLGLQSLAAPGADRIYFYDQSGPNAGFLTPVAPVAISGTTLILDQAPLADLGTGVSTSTDWVVVFDVSDSMWKKVNPEDFNMALTGSIQTRARTVDLDRINNATPVIDSELSGFSLEASSFYSIEAFLAVQTPDSTAENIKVQFVCSVAPTVSTASYTRNNYDGALSSVEGFGDDPLNVKDIDTNDTLVEAIEIRGAIKTGAGVTTLDFYWSQGTLHATRITRIKAGSWIKVTKLS